MISITNVLVLINVLIFIFINQLPASTMSNYYLSRYGLSPVTAADPFIWITSAFLHANLLHIGMNMFALFDLGNTLERQIGKVKFISAYIIAMLFSSFVSFIFVWFFHFNVIVIGASGAIFGLWAIRSVLRNELKEFWGVVVIFHLAVFFFHMPVAWYAHLGGIVAGLIMGYYLRGDLSKIKFI